MQGTVTIENFLAATEQTLDSEDGLLFRSLRQGGFEVVIGLSKFPGRETLLRLAACKDRHAVLQRVFGKSAMKTAAEIIAATNARRPFCSADASAAEIIQALTDAGYVIVTQDELTSLEEAKEDYMHLADRR